jgi:glycerol-3-phosphate dehydrogenase
MGSSRLDEGARAAALEAMAASADGKDEFDLLVIGGGITGAGVALDAVSRGLRVALVEAQDWGGGTSSRSSKLVHGGLRYLQTGDFWLVHEALVERDLLVSRLAPHLIKPTPFILPLKRRIWERAYIGAGLALYDTLATLSVRRRTMPLHRHLSRRGVQKSFPGMTSTAALGGVHYWDAQVDDARFVLTVVRTATQFGAHAASRTQVTGFIRNTEGTILGAEVVDLESGKRLTVRAAHTINATGVWVEQTDELAGGDGMLRVLASKGVHIVVPRGCIEGYAALTIPTEKSVLFVIPWGNYWLIGTTDTPWTGGLQFPTVRPSDIDYLLDHANAVLNRPLTRDDIVASWAGLRPLLKQERKRPSDSVKLSREHSVARTSSGLSSVAGGKLTTYRIMARDAVNIALGSRADDRPSITEQLPLLGAHGVDIIRRQLDSIACEFQWTTERVERLITRYGSLVHELIELARQSPDLAKPLDAASEYVAAEIVYGLTHEGAIHVEDLMLHRTRLHFQDTARALQALPEVLLLAERHAGWTRQRCNAERELYVSRLEVESETTTRESDATAQAVRHDAPRPAPWQESREAAVEVGRA